MEVNKRYRVVYARYGSHIDYFYSAAGKAMGAVCSASTPPWQAEKVVHNIPATIEGLYGMAKQAGVGLIEIEAKIDLSFEAFWKAYNYKVGKRARCEAKWKLHTDSEKMSILATIKDYNRYLSTKSIEKMYPETFLNNRCFENDYR